VCLFVWFWFFPSTVCGFGRLCACFFFFLCAFAFARLSLRTVFNFTGRHNGFFIFVSLYGLGDILWVVSSGIKHVFEVIPYFLTWRFLPPSGHCFPHLLFSFLWLFPVFCAPNSFGSSLFLSTLLCFRFFCFCSGFPLLLPSLSPCYDHYLRCCGFSFFVVQQFFSRSRTFS